MSRSIHHINAELDAEGFRHNRPITSPWPGFANAGEYIADHVERIAEREWRLRDDICEALRKLNEGRQRALLNDWLYESGWIVHRRRGWGRA